MPKEFAHIRKLKDVVDLNLAVNPDYTPKYTGDSANYWQQDILGGKYICPITKEVVGGKTHFCYLRTCGCVMAEKAIKEIPSSTWSRVWQALHRGRRYSDQWIVRLSEWSEA